MDLIISIFVFLVLNFLLAGPSDDSNFIFSTNKFRLLRWEKDMFLFDTDQEI